MFILLHFLLFSHSWPLSLSHCLSLSLRPNHRHHHLATIKPKPKSLKSKLCDLFVSHSHGWSEPKPRPIQAETQGWLDRRLIRPIQAKVDADEEDQQRVNEKRRGWSNPLKQVEKKRPTKRLIRPIEAESEWGVREKEKRSRDKREKNGDQQRQERENKIK